MKSCCADLEFSDHFGFTALHHAVIRAFGDVVVMLLDAGVDVNGQCLELGTPLCLATLRGRANIVTLLLSDYRASIESAGRWTGAPLHCTAHAGSGDVTRILLNHDASTTSSKTIQPRFLRNAASIGPLVADPEGEVSGVGEPWFKILECRPMDLAVYQGHNNLVKMFIDVYHPVNMTHRICWTKCPERKTFDEMSMVVSDILTALMIAACCGNTTLVSLLLNAGAAIDLQDSKGRSALWLAAFAGELDCVKFLVEAGADFDASDAHLRNNLDIALEKRNSNVCPVSEARDRLQSSGIAEGSARHWTQ